MHMADALISPAVGGAFWAASLSAIAYSSRKLKRETDEKLVPLTGVLAAFVFAAQMINFTIPGTGSSGHIGGGLLLAILLGPHAAFIAMASVLVVQALFFADGGLLALGCNIWNLGFYSCFVAYPLIYRPITGNAAGNGRKHVFAAVVSAIAALQLGAFSVVLQTMFSGVSELPFKVFFSFMQPVHLAIGIVEGAVTAGAVAYIRKAGWHENSLPAGLAYKRLAWGIIAVALFTGGALSWFASTLPDGLEWSIERTTGGSGPAASGAGELAASTAPIVGGAIVLGAILAAGFLVSMLMKKNA
jgi:cobalt/nickel transport system permease protein